MRFFLLITLSIFFYSCEKDAEIIDKKLFVYNNKSAIKGNSLENEHNYFRHDSLNYHGFIDTVDFTEDQLRKKLILFYKGKIRTDHVHSFACIRIILFNNQTPIHWSGVLLRDEVVDLNKWNHFEGYFVLPYRNGERMYNRAIVFSEIAEKNKEKFDIDSVEITFKCKDK